MSYVGFGKLKGELSHEGVNNPGAVAASIGRKKYGKKKMAKAAAKGESLEGAKPLSQKERRAKAQRIYEGKE